MENEKRYVGGYEVINSVHIGDKELLLGENMKDSEGKLYMTCYAEQNFIAEVYTEATVSDNFLEIAEVFADRLKEQVTNTLDAQDKICKARKIITADMCNTDIFNENLIGKILVVNASELRPEYRTDINQIFICENGNGANPNGHGSSLYGDHLAMGKRAMFYRCDILGELKPEYYPEWLHNKIEIKENPNVFEYGGLHFVPVGVIAKNVKFEAITKNCETDTTIKAWCNSYEKTRGTPKIEYNYEAFYNTSNKSGADIFKCIENGKFYIPAENELFIYNGKFSEYKTPKTPENHSKKKSKSQKEIER